MRPARRTRKPAFFWQGVLLVLPVAVLGVVGGIALRQDQVLARHEAVERAQGIAHALLPVVRSKLTVVTRPPQQIAHVFQVAPDGTLIFPRPWPALPRSERLEVEHLKPEQRRVWEEAQRSGQSPADSGQVRAAIHAYRAFLRRAPPRDFAATANFALGLAQAGQGNYRAAANRFTEVCAKYGDVVGESGLPLGPLAELRLLELQKSNPSNAPAPSLLTGSFASLDEFCSNAVNQPSVLSPILLSKALDQSTAAEAKRTVRRWQTVWQERDSSRRLYAAAAPILRLALGASGKDRGRAENGGLLWFTANDSMPTWEREERSTGTNAPGRKTNWLAVPLENTTTDAWYICWSEPEARSLAEAAVMSMRPVPEFFDIAIEAAGRSLTEARRASGPSSNASGAKPSHSAPSAPAILGQAAAPGLKVMVSLAEPAALFKRQRLRAYWFGALIAASAFAGAVGLLAAYRAFRRQLLLSELKSNFVSSVSHELRAPIASIRLMAESLDRGKIPEPVKQREYFHFIVQECRRLSSLIENVLDFSRIDQGRKQYEFEPTDLLELTRQTAKLMDTYATERGVTLRLNLPETPVLDAEPSVDGRAVQQSLINLLDNAIKHSPKGSMVTVGLEPGGADHSGVALWVEDEGEGIPPEEHEKIFQRFYRCGSELRRRTQGVGIGLSIVKHVAEAHGGRVLVRSAIGKGSRFTIELRSVEWASGRCSLFPRGWWPKWRKKVQD
jgi:signal transduction histidine kinase